MGLLSKLLVKIKTKSRLGNGLPKSASSAASAKNSDPDSPTATNPHAPPHPSLPMPSIPPLTITPPGPDTPSPPRLSSSAVNPLISHSSTGAASVNPLISHSSAGAASATGLKSMLSDAAMHSGSISHGDIFPNSAETTPPTNNVFRSSGLLSEGPRLSMSMVSGLATTHSDPPPPVSRSQVLLASTGSCRFIQDTNSNQAPSGPQGGPTGSSRSTVPCMDGSTLAAAAAVDASDPQSGQLSYSSFGASISSAELSSWDEDAKGDLRAFALRIVHDGGWVRLGAEERSVIIDHYRSKGLNLEALLSQVQREARAAVMNNKLSDLEYISWDDITGRRGPTSALEKIRCGSKATLYRGRWHGEDVVVKKMDGADKRMQDELSREIYIMSTCTHPNIARIFGIARDPVTDMTCIVMKLYKRGSLLDVMTATEAATFTLAARIKMARGIARGMQYLHDRPNEMITHGDLNPRSILVDDRMRPIITDFGLSTMKTQTKTLVSSTGTRSVLYTAPEVLPLLLISGGLDYKPSPKADVYSFSMILFELFSGVVPFGAADMTEEKVLRLTACGQRPSISRLDAQGECIGPRDAGVGASVGIASPLADIVESCWNQDPELRPSFSQLISMLEAAAEALSLPVD